MYERNFSWLPSLKDLKVILYLSTGPLHMTFVSRIPKARRPNGNLLIPPLEGLRWSSALAASSSLQTVMSLF